MRRDRMLDLLTEQTERPLTRAESEELARLLAEHPDWRADDFELAAAAIDLAFLGKAEAMPAHLAERLLSQEDVAETKEMPARPASVVALPVKPRPLLVWGGWIAAAAAIVIAILSVWIGRAPDPAALRAELLAAGALKVDWGRTGDPAGPELRGDVVWDNATQRGVMRFEGLAANDPAVSQYQLWIFDARRDEAYPVDGGVFDVTAGVVLVPIDAKIAVLEPAAFAVTIERPGGVVVSKRERVVALAKVSG